jgi:uncharacterized protein
VELTLFVDHQCNLRCSYCYTGEKFSRPMSSATMGKAIALALSRGDAELGVSFFGGEPLLHRAFLRETIEHVESAVAALPSPRPGLHFYLNTNGTLMDDEIVALFAPPRRSVVFLSVDGTRQTHDRFRVNRAGKGSFDAVMEGIGKLRAASLQFELASVVTTATAGDLGATIRTLLPLGAAKIHLAPNWRDEWTSEAVAALAAGLDDAGDAWMDWFRAGKLLPLNPLHTKILAHLKGGMPCPSRCQLGGNELCVSPAGRIYPCAQMVGEDADDELVIGHVDTGVDDAARQRLQQAKEQVGEVCQACELRDRCQSDCGCQQLALTGQLGQITEALCELETAFIDQADRVAETLHAEGCEAFIDFYYKRSWTAAAGGKLTQLRRAREL